MERPCGSRPCVATLTGHELGLLYKGGRSTRGVSEWARCLAHSLAAKHANLDGIVESIGRTTIARELVMLAIAAG
jgi:hypothetical protein